MKSRQHNPLFMVGGEDEPAPQHLIARKDTILEAIAVATQHRDYALIDKLRDVLRSK